MLNTAGGAREMLGNIYPFSDPYSQTKPGHWRFLLGGFPGMPVDILASKCLTILITKALCIRQGKALFLDSFRMKNGLISFFKRKVKTK